MFKTKKTPSKVEKIGLMSLRNNKKTKVELLTLTPFIFKEMSTHDTSNLTGRKTINNAIEQWELLQESEESPSPVFLRIPPVEVRDVTTNKSVKTNNKRKRKSSKSNTAGKPVECLDSDPIDDDTSQHSDDSHAEKEEGKTKKRKTSKHITSIIDLIKFAGNLGLDGDNKRALDEVVEQVSRRSLGDVIIRGDTNDMSCEKVLSLYEKYTQPVPTLENIEVEEDIFSTKHIIESSLKQLGIKYPTSKIRVVDRLTTSIIAKNMCYTNNLPTPKNFHTHMDDFIAFEVNDITALKEYVYPPTQAKKKRVDIEWMVVLKKKLKNWEERSKWTCNLSVIAKLAKDVQYLVLYKADTYRKLFPPSSLGFGFADNSGDESSGSESGSNGIK